MIHIFVLNGTAINWPRLVCLRVKYDKAYITTFLITSFCWCLVGLVGLWFSLPLSTIFQSYRDVQFYWWRKPEYAENTTNLSQVILSHNIVSSAPSLNGVRIHNINIQQRESRFECNHASACEQFNHNNNSYHLWQVRGNCVLVFCKSWPLLRWTIFGPTYESHTCSYCGKSRRLRTYNLFTYPVSVAYNGFSGELCCNLIWRPYCCIIWCGSPVWVRRKYNSLFNQRLPSMLWCSEKWYK